MRVLIHPRTITAADKELRARVAVAASCWISGIFVAGTPGTQAHSLLPLSLLKSLPVGTQRR